ncbi:MAG: hypothetical protein QOE55_5914 [Acidobacteriaceae bacterium]|nr:hypothetical protein [Acidobacteriaceae bacterium]
MFPPSRIERLAKEQFDCSYERVAQALRFMRAPPDRHRHHVCGPLAVGVDGARPFDAQGIDGLHDRRGDRARGDRYSTFLLFAIPHDRFRIDIGDTLVDCGVDNRVDLAGAVTWFYDWRGISTGINSGSNFALASLPLAPAFRLTNYVRQLAFSSMDLYVRYWHLSDMPGLTDDVRCRG